MKRQFLLSRLLLLFALIVGSGSNAWAVDVVYKTQQFTTGTSSSFSTNSNSYTGSFDNTYSGFTCNYSNFNNANKGWTYVKCGGKNGAYTGVITTDAAIDKAITKVTLTIDEITANKVTSITLYSSSSKSSGWTSVGTFAKSTGAKDVTISSPAANKFYKIEAVCTQGSSNGLLRISKIQFYVEHVAITSISLPSTESVGVGGTVTLTPTVAPANYTETIDWESDNTGVATVNSSGVVTGVSAGTAHITAKSHGNPSTIYAVCTVTVTAPIAVTDVSLNKTSLDMYFGDTETLSPIIVPANATNKAVSWESDDTKVATVSSDGLVTAVGPGTCTITVTTDDGDFTATCDVTVTIANIDLSAPKVISDWSDINSSYYTSDTYLNIEGYTFKLKQCCRQTTLQFRESVGALTSPTINSTNGYTVIIETATGSNNSGILTLQIGNETAVTVTGPNKTVMATTSSTSTSFTIKNLNSGAMKLAKITIVPNQYSSTVQSYGWATYIAPAAVEFEANTAYVVTDVSSTGAVTVKNVSSVPASTPILLKGAGSKTITVLTEAPNAPETNLLEVYAGGSKGEQVPYVLAKNGDGAGFKKWTGSASTITGRVVLWLDSEISAAATREFLPFNEDETTGINTIENTNTEVKNNVYYNLSGQRVMNPSKGLYIVNGKKVIIK